MADPIPGERFGSRLGRAVQQHGPLCVGLDPHPHLLAAWDLDDTPAGLERFSRILVEGIGGQVAAVKPQVAFFERHGSAGIAVLERVLADLRAAGTLSIADAKRGDIGSTMRAYAQAFLGEEAPMAADAVTLSPYLGLGSLRPAIELATATGRGVFVLALTSNPEGAEVQHAGEPSVAARIVEGVAAHNAGASPMGDIGLVVGATVGESPQEQGIDLAGANGPILAPGVGAQGGTPAALVTTFGPARSLLLPSVSRAVLDGGPGLAGLRRLTQRWQEELTVALHG